MASKLIKLGSHEAENQLELSLRRAFEELQPKLKPPFSLIIPTPEEYSQLNQALLYGILTQPHLAKVHIKHLHGIVSDGYGLFVSLISSLVNGLYVKLVFSVKDQLIWVVKEMVAVLGVGFDGLLVCLLRQINGGDFSDGNLWLCFELLGLFLNQWDCLVEEEPFVLTSGLYVYLRILADHCRVSSDLKLDSLKRLEIEFCVRMLRQQFQLCMKMGRDLVRLLQDLFHVPEFKGVWKDLILSPGEFRTPGFSDVSQLYCSRTSSRYFLLRISPEMEAQLRFLLTHVKFGSQKRYQAWFSRKFLSGPYRETVIVDIVRFLCCAHHPTNEIIQSDIIPRWAVIGWMLKLCKKSYIEANVKLALFYDWLFFDERVDNIMNIEPGMLLIVCSVPKYIDITHNLLEFLLLLVDNYDVDRKHVVLKGLSSAFNALVQKGVVHSLDILTSCSGFSPFLKEKVDKLLLSFIVGVPKEMQQTLDSHYSMFQLSLQNITCLATATPSLELHKPLFQKEAAELSIDAVRLPGASSLPTSSPLVIAGESQVNTMDSLFKRLVDAANGEGPQSLEAVLQDTLSSSVSSDILASRITNQLESMGCGLFSPLELVANVPSLKNGLRCITWQISRTFLLSQHEGIIKMLIFWARKGYPVGARLLDYASSIACEAREAHSSEDAHTESKFVGISDSLTPLLMFHVDGCLSFLNGRKVSSDEAITSDTTVDEKFVDELVENAFAAYKHFLLCSQTNLHKEDVTSLSKLLLTDVLLCSQWEQKRVKCFFYSIFHHLAEICICNKDIIKLMVSRLDHVDLVHIQFEIGLKKFSMFGENSEEIFNLMRTSLGWDPLEQHRLWGLIRAELAVTNVCVGKIILEFFCSVELGANESAIASGGLFALCSCLAPTPELVGAIMLLPTKIFQDFAASVLAIWAVSNASMLFDSLTKFPMELDKKNGGAITMNQSAILWLMNYFSAKGISSFNNWTNFSKDT